MRRPKNEGKGGEDKNKRWYQDEDNHRVMSCL